MHELNAVLGYLVVALHRLPPVLAAEMELLRLDLGGDAGALPPHVHNAEERPVLRVERYVVLRYTFVAILAV